MIAPGFRLAAAILVLAVPSGIASAQVSAEHIRAGVEESSTSAFAEFHDLLMLPNDAHRPEDLEAVLYWLERAFARRGFASRRLATEGIDLLLAERRFPGAERTVLVYLQADGQPVDPLAWAQPDPFSPVLKRPSSAGWELLDWSRLGDADRDPEWRIFARSAADSKGPIVQFLSALSLLDRLGSPDFDLKVIVDTEEELGSPHLAAVVERHADLLAADVLVIFDGPPHASGRPTLTFGARGIVDVTLTTWGPLVPQHSGHYGNWTPNPALRLSQLLASMKDDDGRVTIAGWYDGIAIGEVELRQLRAVPDDEAAIRKAQGLAATDRVAGSLQEAVQYPSLNIRGLASAWVGQQTRTVIPATATAELDIRLVVESDGERLIGLLRRHLESEGFTVLDGEPSMEERLEQPRLVTIDTAVSYDAFRTPFDSLPGRWLGAALERWNASPPILIRTAGGSVPIAPFVAALAVPAVMVPTVNPDNNQHSPNENLRVGDFVHGIGTILSVLTEPLAPHDG